MGCSSPSPNEPTPPPSPDPGIDPVNPPEEKLPTPVFGFDKITLCNNDDNFLCPVFNLSDWTPSSNSEWCKVSRIENFIKISVDPNPSGSSRLAIISLYDSKQNRLGSMIVCQDDVEHEGFTVKAREKGCFFPIFTATWCMFSPDMDHTLEEIERRWDFKIYPMRIHVIGSEFNIPLSNDLSALYDNSYTPAGYFDNATEIQDKIDGNVSIDYFWNKLMCLKNESNGYAANVSPIDVKLEVSEMTITADIKFTPQKGGDYRLAAYFVADGLVAPQETNGKGVIKDYIHDAVFIGSLTPVNGLEFRYLSTQEKSISLSGNIPDAPNVSDIRLLVVLERDDNDLNLSEQLWYVDNCISVPIGVSQRAEGIGNIYIGEEIDI